MQTNFTITSKDVEALQLTVPKVQKTNYKGEAYTGYDYLLTDTDRPLDLLCIAYGLWTHNECTEANMDYISEQRGYVIENNLDYTNAFVASLDKDKKIWYSDNIDAYDTDLQDFTEAQKELLYVGNATGTLAQELEDAENEIYKQLHKEYLHGDYRDEGVLGLLQKKLDENITFEYDDKTGDIAITCEYDEDDNDENYDKNGFLTMLKYRIRGIRHTEATEREAKAIERNRIHEYKKQQAIDNAARELQKKRELLLK